ncbi:M24 family metallopeptidase [Leptolyngbya sp. GB1-A1]|uniref:M24 family metallopeptidase n=1 Tax=Leptolyngbya sp. GB1-A1 TaxID=2933908 RepID=UPI003296B373
MVTALPSAIDQHAATASEIADKLGKLRQALQETGASGVRLRGTDWFAWATAGGSHTVLLAAEAGVADVLITQNGAYILTNEIEAQRLKDEELSGNIYQVEASPWADEEPQKAFIQEVTGGGKVISDCPASGEFPLPHSLIQQKRILLPGEIDRYRQVGRLASEAMTEAMQQAQPDWTEYELAGAGAKAMWARGLHPTLTLVAGERRLPLYRHAVPTGEAIGHRAMMVFCARGFGLYANLTRFISFGKLSEEEQNRHRQVREIEAVALDLSKPETPLNQVYQTLKQTYEQHGYPDGILKHHQGGTTGYLSREVVATPTTTDQLAANMTIAWNPSLPAAKVEDTFLIHPDGTLENLTLDPRWVSIPVHDRSRPLPLEL